MARDGDIIRTADICDDHGDQILVCETALIDYAKRNHFHGQVVTFSTFEDNKGVRDVMAEGGAGRRSGAVFRHLRRRRTSPDPARAPSSRMPAAGRGTTPEGGVAALVS